jgi:hypothetical protein
MLMASVPHDVLATGNRLSGSSRLSSPALSMSVPLRTRGTTMPAAPLTLAGVALLPVMAVLWLVMAAVAVAMFAVTLLLDAGALLLGRPARRSRLPRLSLF